MPIYVLDAPAVVSIEAEASALGLDLRDVLAALTDLAMAGKLICPPIVIRECRTYADGEETTVWLRAVSGHFSDTSEPWEDMETVLSMCPDMLDPDDPDENPQVVVLALAMYKKRTGNKVRVVTDQWVDFPNQQALGNAAGVAGIKAIRTQELLTSLDI